jgi:hypothetical protein
VAPDSGLAVNRLNSFQEFGGQAWGMKGSHDPKATNQLLHLYNRQRRNSSRTFISSRILRLVKLLIASQSADAHGRD